MIEPSPGSPVWRPVSTPRLSDVIVEQIAEAVRSGSLKPGDKLPTEATLGRELGVGRTTVREGLQKLQAYGIVEVKKGLGAYISQPRTEDPIAEFSKWSSANAMAIEDLVEARIALEVLSAGLAALRGSDAEFAGLRRLASDHAAAGRRGDIAGLVETDESFHEAIFRASGNGVLQRIYAILIADLTDFRRKTLALPWAPERSVAGHEKIVDALAARDTTLARNAMADHLLVLYAEVGEAVADTGLEAVSLAPRNALV
jgi:GntR family transcriptional regulator, transcriptional repressor for pyruvate dehydrogenase complex